MRTILQALLIGASSTALLLSAAFLANLFGYYSVSNMLFWQNTLLQSFCPQVNIGTLGHPIYEGTPLNFMAFIASIPVGVLIYSVAAYVILRRHRRFT